MPQITVDDSPARSRSTGTASPSRCTPVVVETAAAKLEACKTRFRPDRGRGRGSGGGRAGHAIVHVTLALLAGRTDETKAKLTEAVLDLLRKHVEPTTGCRGARLRRGARPRRVVPEVRGVAARYEAGGDASAISRTTRSVNGPSPGSFLSVLRSSSVSSSS